LIGGQKGQFYRVRILLSKTMKSEQKSIQSLFNVNNL
jgi:hypothetical protein